MNLWIFYFIFTAPRRTLKFLNTEIAVFMVAVGFVGTAFSQVYTERYAAFIRWPTFVLSTQLATEIKTTGVLHRLCYRMTLGFCRKVSIHVTKTVRRIHTATMLSSVNMKATLSTDNRTRLAQKCLRLTGAKHPRPSYDT
jgi:hypothetical protein